MTGLKMMTSQSARGLNIVVVEVEVEVAVEEFVDEADEVVGGGDKCKYR
jgi:hypothetical protein